jgi:hypothetical protein
MNHSRLLLVLYLVLPIFVHATPSPHEGESSRSHPRLLADSADIVRAKRWMEQSPWYRSIVEEHRAEVDAFITHHPIYVSPLKQTYQYKMYTCPVHDVELLYEEFSPFRHRCPQDTTEVYAGGKYDASWAGWYNRELASKLMWMGILYQLYDDTRYGDAGREILMKFADLYLRYPTDNTILGPAHVFFGTLSESFWGVDIAYGYDLLYNYRGFSEQDRRVLKEKLLLPLARITQLFPETASNRQLWYNNVSAAVGYLYGDQDLIDFALKGKYGFEWQLGSALPESGFWAEWSGYHFVALRGMIHLAEMARHNGLDLYHVRIAGRTMKDMFDVPFEIILPNYEFPRSKDSGGGSLLEYASFYEVGYATFQDRRYLALLNITSRERGTQIVGETSGLGRSRTPITMFNIVPDLPGDTSTLYSARSIDLKGNGFAILRNGSGPDRRYLYLDYGIMGGEHGHPDRLQIGYYARGRTWIVDPLNESYFNPNLQLWYRQTIAHNTLVVDQTSQTWANGEGVFFGALPGLQVASGRSEAVYPGAVLTRTVLQSGDYAIDFFDVACDEPRVLDWPLHGAGSVVLSGITLHAESSSLFGPEPGIPGYDQMQNIQSGTTDGSWSAVFKDVDGERLAVFATGGPSTTVFTATTPPLGGFYKQMVRDRRPLPMILSRRTASQTRFAHLLHAYSGNARIQSFTNDESPNSYRIVHDQGDDVVKADLSRAEYHLVRKIGGSPALLCGFNVHEVSDSGRRLLSSTSLLQTIECRWEATQLEVMADQPLAEVKLWGPAVQTLILNGKNRSFRRDGDFVVLPPSAEPFLELLSPQDSTLVAGSRNIVRVRIWNPGNLPIHGNLTLKPSGDWDALVRSQLEWWGGVVNLQALHKGSVQRTLRPLFRVDEKPFTFSSNEPATVGPGRYKDVRMEIVLAPDVPQVIHPLIVAFGSISLGRSFRVVPPVKATVLIPYGTGERLCVDVKNPTHVRRVVRIALSDSPGWEIQGDRIKTVTVGALGRARAVFTSRFRGTRNPNQYFPIRVELGCGEYATLVERDFYVAVAHHASSPPSLDGSWRGWNRSDPIRIDSSSQISKLLLGNQPWRGSQDLSAALYVMFDSHNLYIGGDVADDSVVTHWNFPMMSYPWDTDCMEVVLDTRISPHQGTDPPTPGLFRHLSLAEHRRTDFAAELWRGGGAGGPLLPKRLLIPEAETFFQKTVKGYAIICRCPLSSLHLRRLRPGTSYGFDIAINDNDGTTYRKNQHIWAGYGQNQSWWDMGSIGVLLIEQ